MRLVFIIVLLAILSHNAQATKSLEYDYNNHGYITNEVARDYVANGKLSIIANDSVILISSDFDIADEVVIYGKRNEIVFDKFNGTNLLIHGPGENDVYTRAEGIYPQLDDLAIERRQVPIGIAKDSLYVSCETRGSADSWPIALAEHGRSLLRTFTYRNFTPGGPMIVNPPLIWIHVCAMRVRTLEETYLRAYPDMG
jgi:hypothetical protein